MEKINNKCNLFSITKTLFLAREIPLLIMLIFLIYTSHRQNYKIDIYFVLLFHIFFEFFRIQGMQKQEQEVRIILDENWL